MLDRTDKEGHGDYRRIFNKTLYVKDLKRLKEKQREQRSLLIYGTKEMKIKLFELSELNKGNGEGNSSGSNVQDKRSADEEKESKDNKDKDSKSQRRSCKQLLLFNPKDRLLSTLDSIMLIVIIYSCFSSAYFTAFGMDLCNAAIFWIENVVFFLFTLEIIFNFMRLSDSDDALKLTDHSSIAKRYLKTGMFFRDFLATFPFYLFTWAQLDCVNGTEDGSDFGIWFKLLRMFRFQRIYKLLDTARFSRFVEAVFSGSTRGKRVVFSLIMKNVYKVFRLILLTIIITFFLGCAFYFISSQQSGDTFISTFGLGDDSPKDSAYKMITSCYFSITTLSTVGYGDLFPISDIEKIVGIIIMLGGVAFFSYIMGSFIEIISTFNQNLGVEDQTFELHNWMTLLTRFRDRKPLPNSLYR